MSEIRPLGPGGLPRRAPSSPPETASEAAPDRPPRISALGHRYDEIAELQRLQSRLDRLHSNVRVPPNGNVLGDSGGPGRSDPTFPRPESIPGDRPMDLARIHGLVRGLLADSPAGGSGPRSEMIGVLRAWCDSRDRIASRLAARG